jgi:uncharacterized protein (TIGR00255 family)
MTGFGKATITLPSKSINIEIKSLNSKQQDVSVRMPSMFKSKEIELRNLLISQLIRGKIEFSMYHENLTTKINYKIDEKVVKAYFSQIQEICSVDEISPEILKLILQLPDVAKNEKEEMNEEDWGIIINAINEAVENLISYRATEGKNMEVDLLLRLSNIQHGLANVLELDKERMDRVTGRLKDAVKEIGEELLDKNRFEQELIYYLEKLDINEEKVRLKSNCDYFLQTMETDELSKGKKLGFISQEIGREINTIGSKANDSAIQKEVVMMKDELEKIKEQLLNVL